ncbi:cytochrome P450 [Rhypophila decipiens]|uniref:Cytochrome P450 n=1 Tax=Rhypophila decipiens TaxID=261697 RepID=A0AAN6Y1M9_9PEZI|nr:cytochrome P450 [Rhypophila decipiens]
MIPFWDYWHILATTGLAILVASLAAVVYCVTVHPLAKFPGPRSAAASGLFVFYHDVFVGGKLHLELQRLHNLYGPIVRIGPNELHICRPEAYDQVYRVGSKATKWSCQRRTEISLFFSRQSVLALEDVLSRPILKLHARLLTAAAAQTSQPEVIPLERAYRCVSLDSVSEISFGRSFDFMAKKDFGKPMHESVEDSLRTICTIRHFPLLVPVFNNIPLWLMRLAGDKLSAVRMMKEFSQQAAQSALESTSDNSARTIITEIVNANKTRGTTVNRQRLEDESLSLIAASADTVGNALTVATYHLLKPENEDILRKLEEELKGALPTNSLICPRYDELSDLPWLTAVVKEALRMSYGLVGRLPRVVPEAGMVVLGQHIPASSVVSMSAYLQHNDLAVFPEPGRFQPQRWLGQEEKQKTNLNRYMVGFGKGSHNCVGSTMAYSIIYKTLATIHLSFELKVEGDITDEDMQYEDRFLGLHAKGSRRLAVSVRRVY